MKIAYLQLAPMACLISSALFFSSNAYALQPSDTVAPQISTTNSSKALVKAKEFMVATSQSTRFTSRFGHSQGRW